MTPVKNRVCYIWEEQILRQLPSMATCLIELFFFICCSVYSVLSHAPTMRLETASACRILFAVPHRD